MAQPACDRKQCPDPGRHRETHCRAAQGFRFTSDDWCNCRCHRQQLCAVDGCEQTCDPRYQMHTSNGYVAMACEGHGAMACEGHGAETANCRAPSLPCTCPLTKKEIT